MEQAQALARLRTLINALEMIEETDTKVRLLHDTLCGSGDFFHESVRPIMDNEDMRSFQDDLLRQIGTIMFESLRTALTEITEPRSKQASTAHGTDRIINSINDDAERLGVDYIIKTCTCDGGGGLPHVPSARCTSGPYFDEPKKVEP